MALTSALLQTAISLGETLQGRIRLSVPNGDGQLAMVPWLLEFKKLHPDTALIRDAVLEGLGAGLIADYLVRDQLARGEVVSALDDWRISIFGNRMHLLYVPDRHQTRALTTFIAFLVGKARDAVAAAP